MKKLLIPVLALLAACSQPQAERQTETYFDPNAFLSAQTAALNAQKPLLSKTIAVGDQPETHQTREVDWAKELQLFEQLNLNKPAFAGSYIVEEISKTTTTYRLKSGEDLPVHYLEVIRDEKSSQPLKVKATLRTKNYLYESERNLNFTCVNGRLVSYEIEGFQRLFFSDPDPFHIEGRIL
ncbi:MAG: hypothetical protein LH606_14530 [Cytophagaceae bacterium]|nr:hypothetical protein [Cytophagaceae bacterium]